MELNEKLESGMLNIELSKVCSTGPASHADHAATSIRSKVSHDKDRKGANASATVNRGLLPDGSVLSTNRMAPSGKSELQHQME